MRLESLAVSPEGVTVVVILSVSEQVLGRIPGLGITSCLVSREHAFVRALSEEEEAPWGGVVELRAGKRSVLVVRQGSNEQLLLQPGERTQLRVGDCLYLEHGDGVPASGFVVRSGIVETAAALSGPALAPSPTAPAIQACDRPQPRPTGLPRGAILAAAAAAKLPRSTGNGGAAAAPSAPFAAASSAPAAASPASKQRARPKTFAKQPSSATHVPAPPADPSPASPTAPPTVPPPVGFLHSVVACFWCKAHTKRLRALIRDRGAQAHDSARSDTTHVVLQHDVLTAAEAAARLAREAAEHAEAQRKAQARASGGRGANGGARGPGYARRQPAASATAAATAAAAPPAAAGRPGAQPSSSSSSSSASGAAGPDRPPGAVCFVTPDYFTACLAEKGLVSEKPFLTRFRPPPLPAPQPPDADAASPQPPSAAGPAAVAAPAPPAPSAAAAAAAEPSAQAVAPLHQQQPPHIQPPSTGEEAATAAAHPDAQAEQPLGLAGPPEEYLVPDPSQICTSLEQWGMDDRWIEPWDEEKARDTLKKLYDIWQPAKRSREAGDGADGAASTAAVATPPLGVGPPVKKMRVDSDAAGPAAEGTGAAAAAPAAAAPRSNGVCEHVACSAQKYCFVRELQRTIGNYSASLLDKLKIKAITKAISVLEELSESIRDEECVERLLSKVGLETRKKVCDIIAGDGTYWRNEAREGDERLRTMAAFAQVWGVGQTTAESCYNRGCRTLEDLSALPDLTTMQRVGLRHHNDFQMRVPRWEIAEAEGIVREEFLQLLMQATGLGRDVLRDRLHVRGAGSYMRGRTDCSDIDLLIAPSPAAYHSRADPSAIAPRPLLQALLERLISLGRVTTEMDGDAPPSAAAEARRGNLSSHHASYMGVWRGPSSPDVARRIDIKLYPWASLPLAINYFCSSMNFSRSIRHYAKWGAPKNAASALKALGVGQHFKLSDHELAPMVMVAGVEHPAGPPLPVRCETDIFTALGLHYVPPHMRAIKW